jgi:hypothetical protein
MHAFMMAVGRARAVARAARAYKIIFSCSWLVHARARGVRACIRTHL